MAKCRLQSRARRERVAKLRERIDETLIDQLPILKGLRFVLEQLALPSPDDIDSKASHPVIVIEQVDHGSVDTLRSSSQLLFLQDSGVTTMHNFYISILCCKVAGIREQLLIRMTGRLCPLRSKSSSAHPMLGPASARPG